MSKKPTTEVTCKPLEVSNGKRPVVIKASKYRKMLATISGQESAKIEAEEQQRYKNYLKKGSDELVAKWGRSFKQSQEQKLVDRNKRFSERHQKEQEEYQKIVAKDENSRREKIAKAEELIQKLKPGPKELQSAAMTSEALKARAYQRNISKEFEETLKKHSAETIFKMEVQSMPWIEEEQGRIADSIKRENEHKAEIAKTIQEKARQKAETTSQVLAAERAARGLCDKEIKAQIDKEQALLKRKREALRKNALEAMIMVEQRRAREQYQDKLQGQLICIYNEGKKKFAELKKEQMAQARQDHFKRNEINAQKLVALHPETLKEEENRFRRDISTIQLQFTAQEKEKIERSRQQKYARIQEYFRELNAQKERELQKTEETRFDLANRLKNTEINAAFVEKQEQEKIQKKLDVRKALTEQIEQHKVNAAEEKELEKQFRPISFEKEDNFFFDYANKLVANAVKKERPLYPFIKVINQYKKENNIGVERKLPAHLESNLRIGLEKEKPACSSKENAPASCAPTPRKYGIAELKSLSGCSFQNQKE